MSLKVKVALLIFIFSFFTNVTAILSASPSSLELRVTPQPSGSTIEGTWDIFLGGYRLRLAGRWEGYATVMRDPYVFAESSLSASSVTDASLSLSPLGFTLFEKGSSRMDLGASYIYRYNRVQTSGNFSMDLDEYGRLDQSFRQDGTLTVHGLLLDLGTRLGVLDLDIRWMPFSSFSFSETADFRPIVAEAQTASTSGNGHIFLDIDTGLGFPIPALKAKGVEIGLGFGYLLWQTQMDRLSLGEVIYSGGVLSGTISPVSRLTRIHQLTPSLDLDVSIGSSKVRLALMYLISRTEDVTAGTTIGSHSPTLSLGVSY